MRMENSLLKLHLIRQVQPERALNKSSVTVYCAGVHVVSATGEWSLPKKYTPHYKHNEKQAFYQDVAMSSLCKTIKAVVRRLLSHERAEAVDMQGDGC